MKKIIKAIDIQDMKDFLTKCNKKHGIIGFEFEDGSFNFGVILAKN